MYKNKSKQHGLVIVYTGGGKGKTTAALGMALRAAGHSQKVLIIQFIKGSFLSGEVKSIKKLSPLVKIVTVGKGFVKIRGDKRPFAEHVRAAQVAVKLAKQAFSSKKYQLVILDEINYAIKGNLIAVKDALNLIKIKPSSVHLVLTGNFASSKIIQKADLVTEMKEIKSPFYQGIRAQEGIDY